MNQSLPIKPNEAFDIRARVWTARLSRRKMLCAVQRVNMFDRAVDPIDEHGTRGNSGRKKLGEQVSWSGNGMKARKAHERTDHVSWGGRGRKFKSCHSDQIKPKTNVFGFIFCFFAPKAASIRHNRPKRNPRKFLTTCLTTNSVNHKRPVSSAPVVLLRSALPHKNSAPEDFSPREPFSLFTA